MTGQRDEQAGTGSADYRTLFESSNDAILIIDPQSRRLLYANKIAYTRLGYTKDEFLKLKIDDLNPPDFDPATDEPLKKLSWGESVVFERAHKHKDGTWMPVEVSASLFDFYGKKSFLGFVRDITPRKEAQKAQQESERRFRGVFNNSAVGISILNMNWEFVETNPAIHKIFGYTNEELKGKTPAFMTHPDYMYQNQKMFHELKSGKRESYQIEKLYIRKDGSHVWGKVSSSLFKDEKGGNQYIVGIIEDISKRKKAEEKLLLASKVFENAGESILVTDARGEVQSVNPAFEKATGYSAEEITGVNVRILKSGRHKKDYYKKMWEALTGEGQWKGEIWNKKKTGEIFPQEVTISVIKDEAGETAQYVAIYEDITERKKAEEKLKMAAEVYEHAVEGVLVTDPAGIIQFVNPAFCRTTGYEVDEVIGKTPRVLKSGRHEKEFYKQMWSDIAKEGRWQGDIWNRKKSGEAYLQKMTITAIKDDNGRTTQYFSVFSDITELWRSEREIEYQAYHDALTGLPNRQLFFDRLKQTIGRVGRVTGKFAVLFIDLDDFKRVNDSMGHAAGDLLLQGVAVRLVDCARGEDTVARLGGDEFTIIIEALKNEEEAVTAAERVISSLSESYIYKGEEIFITVSVGVAIYPSDGETAEDLLRNSDMAMYHVKDFGKNNFKFFTQSMNDKAVRRMELENLIRKALDNEEFEVYFQPKVNLISGEITSFEALVRWRRPNGEIVSPAEFIPMAEETGLIAPLGEQVLAQSLKQLKAWRGAGFGDLSVSVNVSTKELDMGNLSKSVRAALAKEDYPPEALTLEMTESAILNDPDEAMDTFRELRELGVKVSMDDFGTGYSSLSHLRSFPMDELKIDRFFICSVPEDHNDSAIAASIISMAHTMRLKVVAEGVENMEQLDFLFSVGCDEIQGYIFSPPLPADKMEEILKEGRKLVI